MKRKAETGHSVVAIRASVSKIGLKIARHAAVAADLCILGSYHAYLPRPHLLLLKRLPVVTAGGTSQVSTSGRDVSTTQVTKTSSRQVDSAEQPQAVMLLTVAQQMLLDQSKALDTGRLAAFTKALSCVGLHLESGSALGCLSLVNRLLR